MVLAGALLACGALAIPLQACGPDGLTTSAEAPAKPRQFELDGVTYWIDLPNGSELKSTVVGQGVAGQGAVGQGIGGQGIGGKRVEIVFRPRTRSPSLIRISLPPKPTPAKPSVASLGAHGRMLYVVTEAGIGSGGTEVRLEGRLELGRKAFHLSCHIQGEWVSLRDGDWCTRWLRSLRPDIAANTPRH
ncbi:MAG: hypothetical protein AAGC70_07130 [Pseudomonadota bacterium]